MIAAPLMLLAAMVLHSSHGIDGASWFASVEAGPGRFYAAHLLMLAAVALFAPATLALADLLRPSRPAAATGGAVLGVLGLMGIAVLVGMDLVAWQLARSAIDPGQAQALLETTTASPGVVAPLAVLLPGLVLGPALLFLGLHRELLVGGWTAALTPLGLILVFVGLPIAAAAIVGAGMLVVSFGGLGLSLIGYRRATDVSGGTGTGARRAATVRRPLVDPGR